MHAAILWPAALVALAGFFFSMPHTPLPDDNPLDPCPSTPNCVRDSYTYAVPPDTLYRAALEALVHLGPSEIETDHYGAHAVYRVVFFYDDLHMLVEPADAGSTLHLRSASRVGKSDLGVNRRRTNRIVRRIDAAVGAPEATDR